MSETTQTLAIGATRIEIKLADGAVLTLDDPVETALRCSAAAVAESGDGAAAELEFCTLLREAIHVTGDIYVADVARPPGYSRQRRTRDRDLTLTEAIAVFGAVDRYMADLERSSGRGSTRSPAAPTPAR